MNDLSTPLTDEECDLLDRFLLERIDEEADTLDKDEGVLEISELDGLFTALVSGPISTVPSQWLPAVWGNFAPVWGSEKEFQEIFSLMIRHMNSIAHILMEFPEVFEPLFLEREVEGDTYTNGTKLRRLFLCRAEFIRPVAVGGYPHCGYIRDDRWNGNVVGRMNSTLQWAE
ncbi:MAG: UPF0149 family protein [Thiogranum sp.]